MTDGPAMTGCSRRFVLGALLAGAATVASAGAPQRSLRPLPRPSDRRPGQAGEPPRADDADALIAAAKLGGEVAFLVADAATGQILEGRNQSRALAPASTAKILTTLYALDRLGAGYRFATRVIATGPMRGGRLAGDLYLTGGGDPTLDTEGLADLAAATKRSGLLRVDGKLRYWAGALPRQYEITADQPPHLGYNPAISGLNLNYNRVYFEWVRKGAGYAVTMDARSDRRRPVVSTSRMTVVKRRAPLYTFKDGSTVESWTVARDALGKGGGRWLPVRHPGRYAAEVFRVLAQADGIELPGYQQAATVPAGGRVIAERQSDPLSVIARDMLKYSTNLTAEVLGLSASGAPSLQASAAAMDQWLAQRCGCRSVKLLDHSGLGPASRVTAEDMVAALVSSGPRGALLPLLKRIEMRDSAGRALRNHPLTVLGKTGTLNFVSCLVGYCRTPTGRLLAFAILSGDLARRSALPESQQDQPTGAAAWNKRAKALQQKLLERWGALYAA